jgi:hypothetical protein
VRSSFAVRDGVIELGALDVHSDIVKLAGGGSLALDGSLACELDVRYGLVDKLGPFRRLLYWIQNSLFRVTIRGDMARPLVRLQNPLMSIVGRPDDRPRLPLPPFSPLPRRF